MTPTEQSLIAETEALNGYRAAVAFISADSWDGCSDCIEILKAARCADLYHDLHAPDDIARELKRIRKFANTASEHGDHIKDQTNVD